MNEDRQCVEISTVTVWTITVTVCELEHLGSVDFMNPYTDTLSPVSLLFRWIQ